MSQSILVKNLENYQHEFTESLLRIADKNSIYRRFMVGEEMNYNKMMYTKMFAQFLCTDNCELINFIKDKINGKLIEKCDKNKDLKFLIEQYKIQCKKYSCSDSEIIGECVGQINW